MTTGKHRRSRGAILALGATLCAVLLATTSCTHSAAPKPSDSGISLPAGDLSIHGGKPLQLPIGSSTTIPLHSSLAGMRYVLYTSSSSSPEYEDLHHFGVYVDSKPVPASWGLTFSPPGVGIAIRLDVSKLTPEERRQAARVTARALHQRADRAGLQGLTYEALPPDRVVVRCPRAMAEAAKRALALGGSLELRIVATDRVAERERELKRRVRPESSATASRPSPRKRSALRRRPFR